MYSNTLTNVAIDVFERLLRGGSMTTCKLSMKFPLQMVFGSTVCILKMVQAEKK